MNDDAEDVTDLNLLVETAGLTFVSPADEEPETLERALPLHASDESVDGPLPADEEGPTALVAPDTLRRELEKSRKSTAPVPMEAALSDAAQVEALMASSIEKGRQELPTAPAAFPIVKLDAPTDVLAGAGRTVVIPKSTLAEVLVPRGPKGTARMIGAPDLAAAAAAPVAAPQAEGPLRPPRRRSRVALVLLIIVATVVGALVTIFLLDAPRG